MGTDGEENEKFVKMTGKDEKDGDRRGTGTALRRISLG